MKTSLWKPFDSSVANYPYNYYRELRNDFPVFQSQTGEWIISDYSQIKAILADKQAFYVGNRLQWMKHAATYAQQKELDYSAIPEALQSFILFKNPPAHTESRKWIHAHWSNKVATGDLLQQLFAVDDQPFNFVEKIAKPLPLYSIARVLGIPETEASRLKRWSYEIIRVMDLYLTYKDLEQINEASIGLLDYFIEVINNPSRLNKDGVLYKLIQDGEGSEKELASAFIFLFIAGQETTSAFLSTIMYHLADKQLLQEISTYPSEQVVHEFLRFDPPVQLLGRIAQEDVEILDNSIPKGSTLTLCIGAANHDPNVFEHPDKLLFDRQSNSHLSFGFGIHRCLGENMALQIAKEFVEYIKDHTKEISLSGLPEWDRHLSVRRLRTLNLEISWK